MSLKTLVNIDSCYGCLHHYNDVIMGLMASQITSLTIVYSSVYSGTDQRKHQSSTSLAFVRRIHRSLVNSPHKGPVMRKMFPLDDVIMYSASSHYQNQCWLIGWILIKLEIVDQWSTRIPPPHRRGWQRAMGGLQLNIVQNHKAAILKAT